jgi:cytochrome c biogenesis protein ResB
MSASGDVSGVATAVSHGDPIAPVIFGLVLILIAALIGSYLARRTDRSWMLGDLAGGHRQDLRDVANAERTNRKRREEKKRTNAALAH